MASPDELISNSSLTRYHQLNYFFCSDDSVCYEKNVLIFKTCSTMKCRNALGFNFAALTNLCFFVAINMYILEQ